jgi:hypothetical protein
MNPSMIVAVIGAVTTLLGVGGLVSPEFVMHRVVGFTVDPAFAENFVHGEVRAVYGGLFTVMGLQTLWGAMDLPVRRHRVLLLGTLWLGLCAGRLLGIAVTDGPGALGWLSVAFEAVIGGALSACAMLAPAETSPTALPSGVAR